MARVPSRRWKVRWALIAPAILAAPIYAQESSPEWTRAMNNLAHEYITCAAYFSIVAIAGENSGDGELAESYNKVAAQAIENAQMVGDEAGLLPEAHGARLDMAIKQMSEAIGQNTSNIAILMNEHSDACIETIENLEARIQHWVDIEIQRSFPTAPVSPQQP